MHFSLFVIAFFAFLFVLDLVVRRQFDIKVPQGVHEFAVNTYNNRL